MKGGYCIANLILIMKDAFLCKQEYIGRMILEVVATHPSVNVDVSDSMISRLVNRKAEIHKEIRLKAGKPEIMAYAREKIQKTILVEINPFLLDDACIRILKTIREDETASGTLRDQLQNFHNNHNYLDFFLYAILYALSRPNMPPEESVQPEDYYFLRETDFQCPMCTGDLWKYDSKGKRKYLYRIAKIYPENLNKDLAERFREIKDSPEYLDVDSNKIALCYKCAGQYEAVPNVLDYQKLIAAKARITKIHNTARITNDSGLEDEIVDIVKAISNVDTSSDLKPFTDAYEIKKKILACNHLLLLSIRDDVSRFYPFIEKQFSLFEGTQKATFDIIRSEVTTCYEKLEREGLEQEEICDALAEWIVTKKNLGRKHREAAGVVVSFFVQNCAVFKPNEAISDQNAMKEGEQA